ncbi:MAG: type 2 isopentenyl-diphosphate Delta-isomerase [Bacillota bacterium]
MNTNNRLERKMDHLRISCKLSDGPVQTGFDDVYLIHQALPSVDWEKIDTSQTIWGKTLSFPLIINAITGGPKEAGEINKKLATIANHFSIGMAVGSQSSALEMPFTADTFKIARKYHPKGLLIANVGAGIDKSSAIEAVEMLQADALQIHLNAAQEIFMLEGDRHFSVWKENIAEIIAACPVPVILKEVGFGISKETAGVFYELGARWLDISGAGGTNFIKIEEERNYKSNKTSLENWGIPTVASLLEVKKTRLPIKLIASGGIRNGLHMLKSMVLGAECTAAAHPFVYRSVQSPCGENDLVDMLTVWHNDFKKGMFLMGCENIRQLHEAPHVIIGNMKQWIETR